MILNRIPKIEIDIVKCIELIDIAKVWVDG